MRIPNSTARPKEDRCLSAKELADERKVSPFFLFHSMQLVNLTLFDCDDFRGKTTSGPHVDFIFQILLRFFLLYIRQKSLEHTEDHCF